MWRAKIGFSTVEHVGHDIGLAVLSGRRIKGQIKIGVFLRGNLKASQWNSWGEHGDDSVYRRIRIILSNLRGIKCREGVD